MPRGVKAKESLDPSVQEELTASIIEYRRSRVPPPEIAKALDISVAQVNKLYKQALADHALTAMAIDEHRAEEVELIDAAARELMCIAYDSRQTARARIDALLAIVGVCGKAKRELLGLDAPTRSEIRTIGALDAEIAQLEAELNAPKKRAQLPRGHST